MKNKILCLLVLACSALTANAQLITSFGSNASTDDALWTWNQETNLLSGTEATGLILYGESLSTNFTGASQVSVTANATTAPNAGFTFTLEDSSGKVASAFFNWVDFVGGTVTVSANMSAANDFNFSDSGGYIWNIVSGGSGMPINVTLSSVSASAIPEPGAYAALFGATSFGLVMFRRRRMTA
jgi:hypothetical protein